MIIKTLVSDWNLTRIVRLILGILFGLYAINEFDSISAILSIFLLFQAVTNTGCLGRNCVVPENNKYHED